MPDKLFLPIGKLRFELKIGNKLIADKTMKNILLRENIHRGLIKGVTE